MSRAAVPLLRHLHSMLDAPALATRTDRELLDAFASRRDEMAFAALVRRHGPMVHNVCRHVLRQEQDAEDAFRWCSWCWRARRRRWARSSRLWAGCTLSPIARRYRHAS